jgi:hypothetical protein
MKLPATRNLYAYWTELRGERSAPERAELDPARIRTLLCDIFMLEVDDARTYPLRLAGARMSSLFLRELKGEGFIALWSDEDRDDMQAVLTSVLDDPTPAILGVSAAPRGRVRSEFELLLLPLRHFGRTRSRVMGCLTPVDRPSWYGLLPVTGLTTTSLRILNSDPMAGRRLGDSDRQSDQRLTHVPLRRQHLSIYSGGLTTSPIRSE